MPQEKNSQRKREQKTMIITFGFISGVMFGIEFNDDEHFYDLLIDLGIFRVIFSWVKE